MSKWAELVRQVRSLRKARDERLTLETLLQHALPRAPATTDGDGEGSENRAPLEERVLFLVRLVRWIRLGPRILLGLPDLGGDHLERARFRLLFDELDTNPLLRRRVATTLSSILRDTNALHLFAETGMPAELHLFAEMRERVARRLLPAALDIKDLAELFEVLFPSASDARWIESLDESDERRLRGLLSGEPHRVRSDARDALVYLASQVSASGITKDIRSRLGDVPFRDLAFVRLPHAVARFLQDDGGGEEGSHRARSRGLDACLDECNAAITTARLRLVETGVTVRITYELVRIEAEISRIRALVLVVSGTDPKLAFLFAARLVREAHERRDVFGLLRQSSELWARKVVERNAQTGEHYITRTRSEYREMMRMAALGGALTGLTTMIKFAIGAVHFPPLYEAVFFSVNYALSFVAIQLAGGTLATKQPANTAPALAAHLTHVDTDEGMQDFVEEVAHLIRSQAAGIVGNIVSVFPTVLLLDGLLLLVTGHPVVGLEKAEATIDSLSILGPSVAYAAFTGLLLWLGGFAGGMADNWVVFRRIRSVLGTSILFTIAFGRRRARVLGEVVTRHFSGIVASATLGVLLGMSPWVCSGLRLPMEVRHVTLSTGFVAAAVPTLGMHAFATAAFWKAVVGVAAIGTMNVVSSFAIAMRIALSARGIRGAKLRAVVRAVFAHLRRKPLSFVLPRGLPEGTHPHASDTNERASRIDLL